MPPDPKLQLDEHIPWSEPAWLRTGVSPYYNDSHRCLQRSIRTYIDTKVLPHAPEWEEAGEAPAAASLEYCKSGIPFDDVPAPYRPADVPDLTGGGSPHDAFHVLIGMDELSRVEGGVGIALGGASVIGAPPIVHHGTEEQKRRWLPGLFSRETSFCLGVTEPTGGSDVASLRTTAERSADGASYRVNGVKKWITGAPWATHMTTAVRTGGSGAAGVSVLVVPLSSPGVTVRRIRNSGQNAGGASFVELEDVDVPAFNLVGREGAGFPIVMSNFNRERYTLAVNCNRKSRTCLASAHDYARRRETFGKPLIANQVVRRKLVELAHRVEAHWAWLEQVAYAVSSSPRGWQEPAVASQIAMLKVQGGQMLELAAREAQQVFGGAGYQKAGPGSTVEQISRDLRMMVSTCGPVLAFYYVLLY